MYCHTCSQGFSSGVYGGILNKLILSGIVILGFCPYIAKSLNEFNIKLDVIQPLFISKYDFLWIR